MSRPREECLNCGEEAEGRGSLPVNNNGDFVPCSDTGPWTGVRACDTCVALHVAAGDNAPAVLDVYERKMRDQHGELEKLRTARDQIRDIVDAL